MTNDDLQGGHQARAMDLAPEWRRRLVSTVRGSSHSDDPLVVMVLEQAIQAALAGNIGVGALVAAPTGEALTFGQNRLLAPVFRSDLHAEMDALNSLEQQQPRGPVGDLVLYTSLEPCPMCLVRILFSGVGTVRFAADDQMGGAARTFDSLPPVFRSLAEHRDIAPAACDEGLRVLATEIWKFTLPYATARLEDRAAQGRSHPTSVTANGQRMPTVNQGEHPDR